MALVDSSSDGAFLGRSAELSRIDDLLGRSATRFCALGVAGEAGIGKSRLLDQLVARALDRGCQVLAGRGVELEGQLPFAPFVEALDETLASRPHRGLLARYPDLEPLADVFPAWGSGQAVRSVTPAERHQYHRALGRLLSELAKHQPLVVIIDDAHWADDASVETLTHLLRRHPTGPLLLAMAYRLSGAAEILTSALHDLSADANAEVIRLHPLTKEDARPLLGTVADGQRRRDIYRDSGGNPFYIEQLLRQYVTVGSSAEASLPAMEDIVPAGIMASIVADARQLGDEARLLLDGAAVVGDPFEPELAADVAQLPPPRALEVLDDLIDQDWVRPASTARRFRFRHPIVRRAVYELLGPGWRLAAHARADQALRRLDAPATLRAPHVVFTARPGDDAAIELLSAAAEEIVSRAPASAVRWLNAALSILPAEALELRLALLARLADAQVALGRLRAARDTLAELVSNMPHEEGPAYVRAAAAIASLDLHLGQYGGVRDRLERALARQRSAQDRLLLLVELTLDAVVAGELERAEQRGEQGLQIALELDDPRARASALSVLALARAMRGNAAAGLAAADEAAPLLDHLTDDELAGHLHLPYYLGITEVFLDRYADAARHLERGVEVGVSRGHAEFLVPTRTFLGYAKLRLGRIHQAVDVLDEAVEGGLLLKIPAGVAWAGIVAATTWAFIDIQKAVNLGQEAIDALADVDRGVFWMATHAHFGWIASEAGDHQRALDELAVVGSPEFPAFELTRRCLSLEAMMKSAFALGREDEARDLADRALAITNDVPLPLARSVALRAAAGIHVALGMLRSAVEASREAVELAAACSAPGEAARARLVEGRALAHRGQVDEATSVLTMARVAAGDIGARRLEQEAAHALRTLGMSVPAPVARRAGDTGTTELSSREHEVAGLVAEGHTNREIAELLFLSPKTVEGHLRRIFRKLNVTSRTQVAAIVGRESGHTDD